MTVSSKTTLKNPIFNSRITAILYSKNDAFLFIKENPRGVDQILAITPDVRAELTDIELPVICTTDIFTDYSHRRVVARVRRAERDIFQYIDKDEKLSLAAKEVLKYYIHLFISNSSRIWELIKFGNDYLIPIEGEWVHVSDRYLIHKYLLNKVRSGKNKLNKVRLGKNKFSALKKPNFISLSRLINLSIAKRLKNSQSLFVSGYSNGMRDLTKKILLSNSNNRIFRIELSTSGIKYFLYPIISLLRYIFRKNLFTLVVNPDIAPDMGKVVAKLIRGIKDKVIKEGINAWEEFMINEITITEGLQKDILNLLNICKPRSILYSHLCVGSSGVLAEVANSNNIPSILLSHGTHTTHSSAISNYEHQDLARGLLFSPLANETIAQSPSAAEFCELNYPELKWRKTNPLMWAYKKLDNPPKDGIFRILYTGTCNSFRHWIWETPDEYISGLIDFIKKTAHIRNLRIIIKYRTRPELDPSSLRKLLPDYEHYEVKSSGLFLDELCSANLLVSYVSTTIEEALYSRRPVLLWGHSLRYQHLKASSELPTSKKRSAVYMPREKSDLAPMVQAIMKSHRENLLSDNEVKDFVWSYNKEQTESFIKDIFN